MFKFHAKLIIILVFFVSDLTFAIHLPYEGMSYRDEFKFLNHKNLKTIRRIASVSQRCLDNLLGNIPLASRSSQKGRLKKIEVVSEQYDEIYSEVGKTLSGNLATVLRTEWKSKNSYDEGNLLLIEILRQFGDQNLFPQLKIFPENGKLLFHEIVKMLRQKGKSGHVIIRDPAPPAGVTDRTYTYYTPYVSDETGAKHQLRLRSYTRTLLPLQMKINEPVRGIVHGKIIEVTKLSNQKFSMRYFDLDTEVEIGSRFVVTLDELRVLINPDLIVYAYPHSKNYKMELKSRPRELIPENYQNQFPKLGGQNFVQKLGLDVDLESFPMIFPGRDVRVSQRLKMLKELFEQMKLNPKNPPRRIQSLHKFIELALFYNKEFLIPLGATEYERFALEIEVPDQIDGKNVLVQITFDFNMSTKKVVDSEGKVVKPLTANPLGRLTPKDDEEELHIELKVPKVLLEKEVSDTLKALLKLFHQTRVTNRGKFHHIEEQRSIHN